MTHDKTRPVFRYAWPPAPGKLLYMQDASGDENFHVHVVDIATGKDQDLTPYAGPERTRPLGTCRAAASSLSNDR